MVTLRKVNKNQCEISKVSKKKKKRKNDDSKIIS